MAGPLAADVGVLVGGELLQRAGFSFVELAPELGFFLAGFDPQFSVGAFQTFLEDGAGDFLPNLPATFPGDFLPDTLRQGAAFFRTGVFPTDDFAAHSSPT